MPSSRSIRPNRAALASALRNVHIVGAVIGLVVLYLGTRLPAALSPITGADKYPAVSR